jgi:hypothetical protein
VYENRPPATIYCKTFDFDCIRLNIIFLHAILMNNFTFMTLDLEHLATDAYGNTSTMDAHLIENRNSNATMPNFNIHGNSSVMSVPYIRGGYTSLLLGIDQASTLPSRKLNFDGLPNQEICNLCYSKELLIVAYFYSKLCRLGP